MEWLQVVLWLLVWGIPAHCLSQVYIRKLAFFFFLSSLYGLWRVRNWVLLIGQRVSTGAKFYVFMKMWGAWVDVSRALVWLIINGWKVVLSNVRLFHTFFLVFRISLIYEIQSFIMVNHIVVVIIFFLIRAVLMIRVVLNDHNQALRLDLLLFLLESLLHSFFILVQLFLILLLVFLSSHLHLRGKIVGILLGIWGFKNILLFANIVVVFHNFHVVGTNR